MKTTYEHIYTPDREAYFDPQEQSPPSFREMFAINTVFPMRKRDRMLLERVPGVQYTREQGKYRIEIWCAILFDPRRLAAMCRACLETNFRKRHRTPEIGRCCSPWPCSCPRCKQRDE